MLFDIISSCGSDNYLMMYVIPTIDGIILDDRKNLAKIVLSLHDQPSEKNWLTALNHILNIDSFDKTVYEGAARIRSQILAELDRKTYFAQQKSFLQWLLRSKE